MTDQPTLTNEEIAVIDTLGAAMNAFARLEVLHPADANEFGLAIHAAQNIVFARPGMRQYGWPNLGPQLEVQPQGLPNSYLDLIVEGQK
jgi:hypothetical protein